MYKLISDHEGFFLISKDAGAGFHRNAQQPGLTEKLRTDLGLKELYAVHRLDRITSGLLVFAKDHGTAKELSALFRDRLVEKYYLAISDRKPKKKQGLISGDMEKSRRGGWKLTRGKEDPAVTQFFSCSLGSGLRLFLLRPRTGKTHQLRVALKSIGSPVLGDPVYHAKSTESPEPDRAYLHSFAICFQLQGQAFRFTHLPDAGRYFTGEIFYNAVKKFERPWELNWPAVPQDPP